MNQGLLLRFIQADVLAHVFNRLNELGLAAPGFDSTADITACPGTDTCALGVTNSTGLAQVLEQVIETEYPDLIHENYLKIKISGCMNSCGQHMAANIGFHGSSIKKRPLVIPAMQVVLGGGIDKNVGNLEMVISRLRLSENIKCSFAILNSISVYICFRSHF